MKKIRKNLKPIVSVLLCVLMLVTLCTGLLSTKAEAVTQAEVDALRKEKEAISEKKNAQQAVVDELEEQHAGALERKLAMDERNEFTLQQIELNKQEIQLYSEMIEQKAREVEAAKALEEEQLRRYRSRVRAMEENGDYDILGIILRADSFAEMLTLMDDIGEIMESDRKLEDEYIAAREHTETVKAEYEEVKKDLEARQKELRAEQLELEKQIEEAYKIIVAIEADIENQMDEFLRLEEAEDEARKKLDEAAAELERQRQEAANNAAASGGGGGGGGGNTYVGTGTFDWPTPSCYYITSYYGTRTHPVTGEPEKMHYGIDIGAGHGASILAADGGTVTIAYSYGGYGNCVMIDHGNGYTTVYGHMSSIAVSVGQTVSKGATIGYVGSTGVSSGPHLHFEVRYGGACQNPMNFFG